MLRRLAYSLALLLAAANVTAQNKEQTDSLVRLLGCDKLEQTEKHGSYFRRALGHARFEHNSTLLICDTALWNVGAELIQAFGHVRIIQNETVLSSDKLDYYIKQNVAHFRGTVVQLQDKQSNTLRTRFLDYNTRDSVATFHSGGAFRDKDGQVIESENGSYDSKIKLFKFNGNVNMFTDTIFVKTDRLDYDTSAEIAVFGTNTHAWREDNMLSAKAGRYNRREEVFLFHDQVHMLTNGQEGWADSLKYYRNSRDAEMFGHAQIIDTTRDVSAVAGYMYYNDSLSLIKMTRDPAVMAISTQDHKRDTTYVGADSLLYRTVPRCDIDSALVQGAIARLAELDVDPVTEYRRKAAEAARKAAEDARKKLEQEDPNAAGSVDRGRAGVEQSRLQNGQTQQSAPAKHTLPGQRAGGNAARSGGSLSRSGSGITTGGISRNLPVPSDDEFFPPFFAYALANSTVQASDSLSTVSAVQAAGRDSTMTLPADSTAVQDSLQQLPRDSTKIGFLLGLNNVKVFRKDMQVVCDSLTYTDLDSLVRLYKTPIVWNETRRQYSADSITVIIKNRTMERASLMSEAFIIVQEDSLSFDQIKSAEMMAYFDTTGALSRFDAMGGASGLFFLQENDAFATVNKFEAKILTAVFQDGDIHDINYFESVKSDAYPVVQLKKEDKILKGYDWRPELRPKGPEDITALRQRKPERTRYEAIPHARFPQTDIYFPGHMNNVHKMLTQQDSIKQVRRAEKKRLEAERKAREDSLATVPRLDTLAAEHQTSEADSLSLPSGTDSLHVATAALDTLTKSSVRSLTRARIDSLSVGTALSASDRKSAERKARQAADALKRAAADSVRQAKLDAKEAHWAQLDSLDAAKAKVKAEKALRRKRAQTLKKVLALQKREAREQKVFERFKARYERRKARRAARVATEATDQADQFAGDTLDGQVRTKPFQHVHYEIDVAVQTETDEVCRTDGIFLFHPRPFDELQLVKLNRGERKFVDEGVNGDSADGGQLDGPARAGEVMPPVDTGERAVAGGFNAVFNAHARVRKPCARAG